MSSASGISEYVQSNGQTLNAGNYNEMDALTLASLSYIEFEKVYPDYQDRSVSVSQFAKDALASNISLSKTQRQMLDALAESDRYSECCIHNMEAENTSSQWAAMTVDINDGSNTSIIAARGTDGTTLGWNEDFQLAYDDDGTEAQKLMAEYLQNSDAGNIFLTGHSKGGNNVVSAYVMADSTVRDRVVHIDNFDGPGVNDEFREQFREGYAELEGKLDNYYPQDSVIGLLLNDNPGEEHFVYCEQSEEYKSMWILAEHDPYAWHVNEDKTALQSTDQSRLSDALNRILDNTLDQLTQEERRQVVNALITMQVPALIGEEGTLYSVFDEPLKWMNIAFGGAEYRSNYDYKHRLQDHYGFYALQQSYGGAKGAAEKDAGNTDRSGGGNLRHADGERNAGLAGGKVSLCGRCGPGYTGGAGGPGGPDLELCGNHPRGSGDLVQSSAGVPVWQQNALWAGRRRPCNL